VAATGLTLRGARGPAWAATGCFLLSAGDDANVYSLPWAPAIGICLGLACAGGAGALAVGRAA
jgi:hypothetical protein